MQKHNGRRFAIQNLVNVLDRRTRKVIMADVTLLRKFTTGCFARTVTELPPPGGLRMIDTVDFSLSGNGGSLAMALARLGISVELAGHAARM